MSDLLNREPKAFFRYFKEISAIPRGSGNEKALGDYLVGFALSHNLECTRDKVGNVLIRKPAFPSARVDDAVLIQGHMDMVCEKNVGTVHDFMKDPIKLVERDGFLYAQGTTLGADNGVAVAYMLAILDDDSLLHPDLECLFTVQEETGLIGAERFDASPIRAKLMINLDSGPDDTLLISCAGGMRTHLTKTFACVPFSGEALRISVRGLAGGHSGDDIGKCRGNAIKLIGRVLLNLSEETAICLASICGGGKDNAIPRECDAVIASADPEAVQRIVGNLETIIKEELGVKDGGVRLSCESCDMPSGMMDSRDSKELIALLNLAPNGVLTMSPRMEGLVESSCNLGVIVTEGSEVTLTFAPRSSVESLQDDTQLKLELLAKIFGCSYCHDSRYPGWQYEPQSKLREIFAQCYRELNGSTMKMEAIHAGLECGLIKAKKPVLDIVSTGPAIYDFHTPNEHLDLESCFRLWKLLKKVLGMLAGKV